MNKEQKQSYIKNMTAQFENSESVLVTHYQGLTVKQLDELRAENKAYINDFHKSEFFTSFFEFC